MIAVICVALMLIWIIASVVGSYWLTFQIMTNNGADLMTLTTSNWDMYWFIGIGLVVSILLIVIGFVGIKFFQHKLEEMLL